MKLVHLHWRPPSSRFQHCKCKVKYKVQGRALQSIEVRALQVQGAVQGARWSIAKHQGSSIGSASSRPLLSFAVTTDKWQPDVRPLLPGPLSADPLSILWSTISTGNGAQAIPVQNSGARFCEAFEVNRTEVKGVERVMAWKTCFPVLLPPRVKPFFFNSRNTFRLLRFGSY